MQKIKVAAMTSAEKHTLMLDSALFVDTQTSVRTKGRQSGASCSKLTTSLVNVSLKFQR